MQDFFIRYINGDRSLGSRYGTMRMAISMLNHDKDNVFVETGTTRKNKMNTPKVEDRAADGCSTVMFGDYVSKFGGHVWTCDIDPMNIMNCRIATEEYEDHITYVTDDSLNFLQSFDKQIDFLYLDSVDSHVPGAKEHQLEEIKIALPKLHKNSVVLLDDLEKTGHGKTSLSIPFLKANGWCQILIDIPSPPSRHNNFMQGLFLSEESLYFNHWALPEHERFVQNG